MNFMQLLNTLDELLFELMSWLVFYPVTLWRTLRHPFRMMKYADTELGKTDDAQYAETMSPPLFLLASLILSHAIELALVGDSPLIRETRGLAGLVTDDTSLIVLRLLMFSIFPLVMATRSVRAQGHRLSRDTLKLPFYSQCYPAAVFALVLGLGGTLTTLHVPWAVLAGLALMAMAFIAYGVLQIRWFAHNLGGKLGRGIFQASLAMVESLVLLWLCLMLFA